MEEKRRCMNFDDLKEGLSFVGEVVGAVWETGQFGRDQLHIQVKPLDHEVKGEKSTGVYHEWFTESDRKNSKYGEFLKQLKNIGVSIKSEKDLIGLQAVWERRNIDFGDDLKAEDVLLPVELKKSSVDNSKKFEELVMKLKTDGMTSGQITKFAQRAGITKSELDSFMKSMESSGKLFKDADGVYTVRE